MERIYGISHGGDRSKSSKGTFGKPEMTQQELAAQMGIDVNTLKRAKALTSLPPEIQDLVEQGTISPSTASRLIAKLTPIHSQINRSIDRFLIISLTETQSFYHILSRKITQSHLTHLTALYQPFGLCILFDIDLLKIGYRATQRAGLCQRGGKIFDKL